MGTGTRMRMRMRKEKKREGNEMRLERSCLSLRSRLLNLSF